VKKAVLFISMLIPAAALCAASVYNIFSEEIEREGTYNYSYPTDGTSEIRTTNIEKHSGNYSMKVTLNPSGYSGAAIGNYPPMDLAQCRETGALEFWIKGEKGGEKCEVLLLDDSNNDGTKTESGVVIAPKYAAITKDWQKVSIPLKAFPDEGQYWDGEKTVKNAVNWKEIVEFKIASRPYDKNSEFTVYIDDVNIVTP
jgi:hypothetical protein